VREYIYTVLNRDLHRVHRGHHYHGSIHTNVVYYIDRDVNGVGIVSGSGRVFDINERT
jgi:hypothetical protein